MAVSRTKVTTLGISCPKCTLHTPETVDVLFGCEELECTHCGATIDIRSGPTRKYIEDVFLACESADQADEQG